MIYLTSDTHFNHKNILAYEPTSRPFASVEEMNEAIIEKWNSVVSPEDEVYHLGDFFMGQLTEIEPILNRLNGKITLIRGNHDQSNRMKIYKEHGIVIKDIEYLKYKGRFFILCHFPIANEEFIKMVIKDNSEVVNLYGHVHSNAPKGYVNGTYHVGMDTNDLTPISIEQIWSECWPAEIMTPLVATYKEKCSSCINEDAFCRPVADGKCPTGKTYKKNPPDGGFYG